MTTAPDPGEAARIRSELDRYVWWLDECIRLPGLGWRIGLDGLIGLIPGFGDAITAAAGLAMVVRARKLGAPGHLQRRMVANLAVDFVIGLVPLVGDLFDFAWRANRRNLELLREYWNTQSLADQSSSRHRRWLPLIAIAALVVAFIGLFAR